MELATGPERTIDGIANGREIVLGHPKTREAMRAGLAMYFVTLEDPGLMELADAIVAELGIEHFFNIQLVGDAVIEINPRISTIVYQEDLNLPYLGVKRAIGEISDDELRALRSRIRPGRTALRYFDQLEWSMRADSVSAMPAPPAAPWGDRRGSIAGRPVKSAPLRVTHCPVNIAGDSLGERAGAAARRGRRASSSSSTAASSIPRPTGRSTATARFRRRLLTQFGSASRGSCPSTDIFHFYFGLTLVPKSLQFPILAR